MVMNIANALSAYRQSASNAIAGSTKEDMAGVSSFSDTLKGFFGDSLNTVKQAEKAASDGAVGKADMQSVVLAVDKAGTALDTVMAVRDKVITAYQEILRMQI